MKDTGPINTMTLRDQFAVHALSGLIASDSNAEYSTKNLCETAYEYADEMLKARSSKPMTSRYGKKK